MKQEFKHYKEFLTEEGKKELKSQGYWIEEEWNGEKIWSTPLMDNHGACAYVVYENGIALCGIEKAWKAGKTNFRKPVSCHLYPIRVQTLKNGTEALNYNRWKICSPACSNGKKLGVPVYQFLQEAIIRRYGEAFYAELDEVGKQWRGNKHHNI